MPHYKIRKFYLHLKESKLEIMQLIIGKLIRRGFKMRAFNIWLKVLVLIKLNFIRPKLGLYNINQIPEFFKPNLPKDVIRFSIKSHNLILSDQQQAFMKIHNLQSIFKQNFVTCLDQFIYTAFDNICPIVLFVKRQQQRRLILLPLYTKHARDIKLGLTWLTFCAQDLSYYPTLSIANRIYIELVKALNHDLDSNIIDIKLQFYSLAYRNKKYIQARQYF
jgi:hypothetical protein